MPTRRRLSTLRLLSVPTRREWRAWLRKHHKSETEIWLVFYKAHSGRSRISYNDAVEEALCFGWIDSTVRRIDADRYAQKFSVRRRGSRYSQANIERLRELVKKGRVTRSVVATLGTILKKPFTIPPDILRAIKRDPEAWMNFQRLSASYIRIRIAFIEGARKRPDVFKKRLRYFIKMTEKNKKFGFGGIEKYF